ncbi:selenide, water dikinase SelD, partial [bacterium]|nr:selenide, water dikinase SelD [bacterium]
MVVNLKRRKSVMARSMRLGHCVCNPKNPCPCDIFIRHNVCPCAGEKLPVTSGPVALTRHVRKAGCASKIGQADLLKVIGGLPEIENKNVLVGAAAGDDAGVYRLDEGCCLVQTVDVFTPNVDDPYLFGQIAAANSVSDIYAMGGRPLTALSIVGFPIDVLDASILAEILRGGIDKMNEADCAVIGGHSINDEEIKCGFAVTGLIEPEKVVQRNAARGGDVLILTKPLGTGMVSFAAQIGRAEPGVLEVAGVWMATLNKDAAELMARYGAHACTDVTGFGLMGHLVEMIRTSGLTAEIVLESLPVLGPVQACLEQGILSGSIESNQEYSWAWLRVEDSEAEKALPVLFDPQTSGGLLVALPEEKAAGYVGEMRERGHEAASIIGRVRERSGSQREGEVVLKGRRLLNLIGEGEGILREKEEEKVSEEVCCASTPGMGSTCFAGGE